MRLSTILIHSNSKQRSRGRHGAARAVHPSRQASAVTLAKKVSRGERYLARCLCYLTRRLYDDFMDSSYSPKPRATVARCGCRKMSSLVLSPGGVVQACSTSVKALPKCDTGRLSCCRYLDRRSTRTFNPNSSGVPVALAGQEGIRCVSPFQGEAMPELRPQLSAASTSLRCHWALRCKVWEGGEER